jgi:hypothetical protein
VVVGSGGSATLRRGDSAWLDARDVEAKVASAAEPAQLFVATDGLCEGVPGSP